MTKPLSKLQEIARAATPGPWIKGEEYGRCHIKHQHGQGDCRYQYTIEDGNHVLVPRGEGERSITLVGCDDYGDFLKEQDATYIATFNPSLMQKILAELKAAREALSFTSPYSPVRAHDDEVIAYDKAREAVDAEILKEEIDK